MFLGCQIDSCSSQPEGFEKKISEKQLSFTVIASLYKHSAVLQRVTVLHVRSFSFFSLLYESNR